VKAYDATVEPDTEDDESVETFPVSVEGGGIVLHV
jgi:hypothetical protein